MAEFLGFEIETPQEVLARVQQGNQALQQQAAGARNAAQADAALFMSSLNNVAGQVDAGIQGRKMRKLAEATAEASKDLPSSTSPIARQEIQLRAQQRVAQDLGDSGLELQINGKLLELEQQKVEQSRLAETDRITRENLASQVTARKLRAKELQQRIDHADTAKNSVVLVSGSAGNARIRTYDQRDPEQVELMQADLAEAEALAAQDPNALVAQVPDMETARKFLGKGGLGLAGDDENDEAGLTNSGYTKLSEGTTAAMGSLDSAESILKSLAVIPTAGTGAARAEAVAINVGNQVLNTGRELFEAFEGTSVGTEFERELSDAFTELEITSASVRANLRALAYTTARTFDPSGRLSDFDVQTFMQVVAGNGTPESIARNINEVVLGSATRHADSLLRHNHSGLTGQAAEITNRVTKMAPLFKAIGFDPEASGAQQDAAVESRLRDRSEAEASRVTDPNVVQDEELGSFTIGDF